MRDEIDISQRLGLALRALGALVPHAEAAGIVTDCAEAYDEWEGVVWAIFTSFVVLPLCDTTGRWSPDQFHRLGFDVTDPAKLAVLADHAGAAVFVFDIAKDSAGRMRLLLRSAGLGAGEHDVFASPEACRSFRIGPLAGFSG